jgi:hypothetical protein
VEDQVCQTPLVIAQVLESYQEVFITWRAEGPALLKVTQQLRKGGLAAAELAVVKIQT